MLYWLLVTYFIAGIGSLFASFLLKIVLGGSSALFTHGKSKVSLKDEPKLTRFVAKFTVSKRWFWHFYALGSICSAISLQFYWSFPSFLLFIQCLRRLIESFTIMPGGKDSEMHLIHYLIGVTYYPALITAFSYSESKPNLMGLILFAVTSVVQSYTHYLLGKQRSSSLKYRPIDHPLFRFVHAPHYLTEFLIYLAIGICMPVSYFSVLNLGWIALMLGTSAKSSADFICKTGNYKSHKQFSRHLMFPFIY